MAALFLLIGMAGCGESQDKLTADGTAYFSSLVAQIPNARIDLVRYRVAGPQTTTHFATLEISTDSTSEAEIARLLTAGYRAAAQAVEHQHGTDRASFSVVVTDGNGAVHRGQDAGLPDHPTYDQVVEWLKTR